VTNILAIDTSTPACSVAIRWGGETLTRHRLASREHTKLLLPMVDELLSEVDIGLSQIDVIAFTAGPGSFTGIRIGFGVVQGLAFGADLPVLPVSTLETLAYTATRKLCLESDASVQIIPMLDARMDEIYWAQFQIPKAPEVPGNQESLLLERVCEDHLSAPEQVLPIMNDASTSSKASVIVAVGDGWNYCDRLSFKATNADPMLLPEAKDILAIAEPLIGTEKVISIDEASPIYLRDKITWKKRERLRERLE
jgi:tRNA threonylcarbamoyladenosine biosynthesis protein TsaB